MVSGRRRTDVPDALWRGTGPELSDHPTQAGRDRSERRRGVAAPGADPARRPAAPPVPGASAAGARPREDGRQISRSRLPLPPVPAAARGAAPAARPEAPAGPLTTAAPFRAVPTPELRPELPGGDAFAPARSAAGPARAGSPSRPLASSGPMPRVPRQTAPDGLDPASYGDWTPAARPLAGNAALGEPAGNLLVRPAPATTAIPERSVSGRRGRSADPVDDEAPAAVRGPGTGSVGGRAALRAERQAADMARRKAEAKRNGGSLSALPEEDEEPRKPRGVIKGLVAMAVVGLGVLGVYTWVAPTPQDASAQSPAVTSTAPSTTAPVNELPALPTDPIVVEPTVAAPVRVPVTVLNATAVNGLAGKISATIVGAGWESPGVGAYEGGDVAVSTVFFTEGDENQRQAALQLIEQFPQLQGPAPRFFELPADVTVPGLVVVAAGDWQP